MCSVTGTPVWRVNAASTRSKHRCSGPDQTAATSSVRPLMRVASGSGPLTQPETTAGGEHSRHRAARAGASRGCVAFTFPAFVFAYGPGCGAADHPPAGAIAATVVSAQVPSGAFAFVNWALRLWACLPAG